MSGEPPFPEQQRPLTQLLNRFGDGEVEVEAELLQLVYDDLRGLARQQLGAQAGQHTLQPTALVHEAWLRLGRQAHLQFDRRRQFFMLASKVMRSVLLDHARGANREKRGGGRLRVSLVDRLGELTPALDLIALEEALVRLENHDPDLVRLVELRFFSGLAHAEIAEVMKVSIRTIERHWRYVRAWLHNELTHE
jgi:RNA polymerase sigma factor (TIGR02999 family)